MKKNIAFLLGITILVALGCQMTNKEDKPTMSIHMPKKKEVIYQVFTRLFGNKKTTNTPWGTIEENGVGKFADFDELALSELKKLGITYMWYTGVPHHALINDYTAYRISNDDPDVVKGRAGSPYAVKDYYNVNPDLAVDPAMRLEEFKALIARTHQAGMKVIIDIVPNHVARKYEVENKSEGVTNFGADDDTTVVFSKHNNFYYVPGEGFKVPRWENNYLPLGGEKNSLSDNKFEENPAKWTGNGARSPQPHYNDWYETVKINYGVDPEGHQHFDALPETFGQEDYKTHFEFWKDKEVPNSWVKFRDIALYWTDMGVDGFRYDMAEMVPVEFWSYMNSAIKMKNQDAFLLAEVYNPSLYREYIYKGKMDYLYDKVELYDTLKHIIQGHGWTDHIVNIQNGLADIEHNMLHFLENHDEQRIASPDFAGNAEKGKPMMVLSTTISSSPTMVYFGQEVGEPAVENAGFGSATRTSIFDYVGVPNHQRWMNNGLFDGGQLTDQETSLRDFYKRLLNFSIHSKALMGQYQELHSYNRQHTENYTHRVFSFARWSADEKLIIMTNFDEHASYDFDFKLDEDLINTWNLTDGEYHLEEMLYGEQTSSLKVSNMKGGIRIKLMPLESLIFQLQ